MNTPSSSPAEISVDQLKRDWEQLHSLERAKAIFRINKSGMSLRQIARQVGRSEALIRHLLKALKAPAEDLIASRQGKLSTNELVRRAKARRLRRESERRKAAGAHRVEAAYRAADLICNWLAGECIYGPDGERIIDYVRGEYAIRTLDGSLTPQMPEDTKLSREELIRKWKPIQARPDGAASVSWYHQWLFRWSFYAFPDSEVRDMALDLTLEKQWKR